MRRKLRRRFADLMQVRKSSAAEFVVRRIADPAEYRACQDLQARTWGITDAGYVVPVATMIGVQHHGGLVIGAFSSEDKLVGFSFAFLGRIRGQLCLYSQLTGVDPGFQRRGIGETLKLAQREYARTEGIPLIAWAFDPLQAGNANFNLEKLGAIVRQYVDDMYGSRTDELNVGLPTDRVIAEWTSVPGESPVPPPDLPPPVIDVVAGPYALLDVGAVNTEIESPWLSVEVPSDMNRVKERDSRLAGRWQAAVGTALKAYFSRGYAAVRFSRASPKEPARCYYLLRKEESMNR
jgi:predicted GNAT superfamily acetyltransferase